MDAPETHTDRSFSQSIRVVGLILLGLIVVAALVIVKFRPAATPPPAEIASDPQLVQGRVLFLDRCASCHGQTGHGDGPIAKTLKAGRAGDLTLGDRKYGDTPEKVMAIIVSGTPEGEMPGWGRVFSSDDLKSVAGYVFYLAGKPVPAQFRTPVGR